LMEAQQEQRVRMRRSGEAGALRTAMLGWKMVVDEQKLYKPFRAMYARFAMFQQDVDERCVWWHGPQAW
jgi:hypothetical protein